MLSGSMLISGAQFLILNGRLVASVSGSALTVSIKTASGNDPSPGEPLFTSFLTQSSGSISVDASPIAAPLSVTISAGSTLGAVSGVAFRLWVVLFNDAGTLRLGIQNSTDGTGVPPRIYPLFDAVAAKSFAEGGAGAADGAGNIYTTVAVASALCRIVGTLEWSSGLATAGTWSATPDIIKLYSAESNKPGSIVQEDISESGSVQTTTTLIPLDNTIPQITEGSEVISVLLAAQSACNVVEIETVLNVSHSVSSAVIAALFIDSTTDAIACGWSQVSASDAIAQIAVTHRLLVRDTSFHSYRVRIGAVLAGTLTLNGTSGAPKLNATLLSSLKIRELAG